MKVNRDKNVFEVICWWDDDYNDKHIVYVVAMDDDEVEAKMEAYKKQLIKKGCAELNWIPSYIVEIDYVLD